MAAHKVVEGGQRLGLAATLRLSMVARIAKDQRTKRATPSIVQVRANRYRHAAVKHNYNHLLGIWLGSTTLCSHHVAHVCAVDGGWSNWTACSQTCGGGTHSRNCTNPSPRYGGKNCTGPSEEQCHAEHCPGMSSNHCILWSKYAHMHFPVCR